ncbi:MAG: transglutaminase N-terminal domain-containing protein [Desertimonas sp.]
MSPTGPPTLDQAIRYRVWHRTTYRYSRPMTDGYTVAFVLPRPTRWQSVEWARVEIDPTPDERSERTDVFGNRVLQLGVHHSHEQLTLHAESSVLVDTQPLDGVGPAWEDTRDAIAALEGGDALNVRPFVGRSPFVDPVEGGDALEAFAAPIFTPGRPVLDAARDLTHTIFSTFTFDPRVTEIWTPISAVLAGRRGVCQDFAHLAIAVLRSRGLAARYVSGYIETTPPEGQPRLVGADATHAWCSLWIPDIGWVDIDPTNDHVPISRHVTVAWGRDYGDVAPVRGVVIGPAATQGLSVAVDVSRQPV